MFSYIIDKIHKSEKVSCPFELVYIDDLFSDCHFQAIISSADICIEPQRNDLDLFDILKERCYLPIQFPGTAETISEYLDWHSKRDRRTAIQRQCEGFGLVLRLSKPSSPIIMELNNFIASDDFKAVLAEKFEIDLACTRYVSGIQKYLDGYEISPHPDVRKKALTFMVNINPASDADDESYHTHYLTLKDEYRHIQDIWENNNELDRCWLPWEWCDTNWCQTRNNSLSVFSPNNTTLHAVKANYNHLNNQRTQLYGNMWYTQKHSASDTLTKPRWYELEEIRGPGRRLRVSRRSSAPLSTR